jgi:VanZ family protein
MIQTFARIAAWTLAIAIVVMTLGPVGLRPQFGHPSIERFVAYLAVGGAFSVGYPRHRAWVALAVVCGAMGLEMGQLLVPGRDARVGDALIKAFGAVSGVMAVTSVGAGRRTIVE